MESYSILIVEDEVVVSTDLKMKLEKRGYGVCGVIRYGEKVLDALRENRADLVLMDIQLKGDMDGIDAAELLLSEFDLPIVFLTAFSDRDTLARVRKSGPYAFLQKPVRPDDLQNSIEIALYKAEMEKKLKESEVRFRTVADFTFDWETWVGTSGELIYTSPSCERITGYSRDQFLADPQLLYRIMISGKDESLEEQFRNHKHDKENNISMEFPILRQDGEIRWIEHICSPVYSDKGEYLGRRASNRDISNRKRIEKEQDELIKKLKSAMDNINTLSGMLPICCNCKKIRDDKGYWNQIEKYINEHTGAEFSHGLCPECAREIYPEHFPKGDNL